MPARRTRRGAGRPVAGSGPSVLEPLPRPTNPDLEPPDAPASTAPGDRSLAAAALLSDLDDRLETLMRAARRVRAHADDDAVHDLRVASRRLIAAVDVWRDALRAKSARSLRRRARRLRRRAGAVRDVEVHAARLRDLQARITGPAQELAAALAAERENLVRDGLDHMRDPLDPGTLRRLAARHSRTTRDLRTASPDAPLALDGALAVRDRRATQARAALLPALATGHPELLHAARVAIKKWRYASENLTALGLAEDEPLGVLRQLQQSLGHIQDTNTLLAYLDDAAPDIKARAALRDTLRDDLSASLADARRQARELP